MTTKETRRIIEEANFYASSYNYSRSHHDDERAARMLNSFEAITMLANRLNIKIDIVRSEQLYFAAVGTNLGGGKYFVLWATSCDSFVDNETYKEYTLFADKTEANHMTVYTTDGNGGMMIRSK